MYWDKKFEGICLFHVEIFPSVSIEETLAEKAASKTNKIAFLSKSSNLILSLSQEQLGNSSNFPQPWPKNMLKSTCYT